MAGGGALRRQKKKKIVLYGSNTISNTNFNIVLYVSNTIDSIAMSNTIDTIPRVPRGIVSMVIRY